MTDQEIDAGTLARSARRVYVSALGAAGYEATDVPAVTLPAWEGVAVWLFGAAEGALELTVAEAADSASAAFRNALPGVVVSDATPSAERLAWMAVAQHLYLALYGEEDLPDLEKTWPAWVRERLNEKEYDDGPER